MDVDYWDQRSALDGFGAVMSARWSDPERCLADRAMKALVLSMLGAVETVGRAWLEVGCGTGRMLSVAVSELARPIVGVDFSSGMLARAKVAFGNETSVEFVHSDVTELPFSDDTFDIAVSVMTLQVLVDRVSFAAAAAELSRVLKPGGVFVGVEGTVDAHRYFGRELSLVGETSSWVPSIDDYSKHLGSALSPIAISHVVLAGDPYSAMSWMKKI